LRLRAIEGQRGQHYRVFSAARPDKNKVVESGITAKYRAPETYFDRRTVGQCRPSEDRPSDALPGMMRKLHTKFIMGHKSEPFLLVSAVPRDMRKRRIRAFVC
jgi:hypothetical protein